MSKIGARLKMGLAGRLLFSFTNSRKDRKVIAIYGLRVFDLHRHQTKVPFQHQRSTGGELRPSSRSTNGSSRFSNWKIASGTGIWPTTKPNSSQPSSPTDCWCVTATAAARRRTRKCRRSLTSSGFSDSLIHVLISLC